MTKLKKITKAKKQKIIKIFRSIAIVVVLFAILLLPTQIPQYSFHYVICGFKKPVKIVPRGLGASAGNYVLPTVHEYEGYMIITRGYYCTEQAAKNAGYKNLFNKDGTFSSGSTGIH